MNRVEIVNLLNTLNLMYPSAFKDLDNPRRRDKYIEIYEKQLGAFEYQDVENGLYHYNATNQTNFQPSIAALIELAKIEKRQRANQSGGHRRIVTPEEDCFNEFKERMAKGKNMSQEDIETCKRLQKYEELFRGDGWEERYKKRFGMSREEFERYD